MHDPNSTLDTRSRILAAALEIFAERGFDGTTTREVANRAGVAELTLFRHFGNKRNLLQSALAPVAFMPAETQRTIGLESRPDPRVFFTQLAQRLWDGMMGPRRRLLRVMVGEAARRPELNQSMSQMPREFAARIGAYLASLQAQGKVRPGNPRLMALAFLGMFFAVAVSGEYFSLEGEEFTPGETRRTYVDLFLHGVFTDTTDESDEADGD